MRFENKLGRRTWTPGRRKLEGLVSRADSPGVWGERPGIISLTASTNCPACDGGLSVTCAAAARDKGKTRNGRHPIQDASRCETRRIQLRCDLVRYTAAIGSAIGGGAKQIAIAVQ